MNRGKSIARLNTIRRGALAAAVAVTLSLQASPARASKSSSDDDEALPDARLLGYQNEVKIAGGTMGTYMLLTFLGVLAIGVTFKNARRSHLD